MIGLKMVCAAIIFAAICGSGFPAQPTAANKPCCSIVEQALSAVSAIKPGMTRADVERDSIEDGGAQFFGQPTRYVYRRCTKIKIDVDFAAHDPATSRGTPDPQDRIKSVSRSYLEYMFMD